MGIEIIDLNRPKLDKNLPGTDPEIIFTYIDPNFQDPNYPDPTRPDPNLI